MRANDREGTVVLVDGCDRTVGTCDKMGAHREALLHRAVSVFIFNRKGEWLLQRRHRDKYHSGGLWTNACCTHPLPGELPSEAARRCLERELGLESPLDKLFDFVYRAEVGNGLIEYEFDHVFVGVSDALPRLNPGEAEAYRYAPFGTIRTEMTRFPETYTVWFGKIYDRVQYLRNW